MTAANGALTRDQVEAIRLGGTLRITDPSVRWPTLLSLANSIPSRRGSIVAALIEYAQLLMHEQAAATYDPASDS